MKIAFYSLTDEDLFLNRLPVARYLEDAGYRVVFAASASSLAERIREDGFEFYRIVGDGRTVVGDVAATFSLARVLKHVKPDIFHTFGLRAGLRGGLAARMRRLSWVVHSVSRLQPDVSRRPPAILRAALRDAEVTFRRREDRDAFIAKHYVRPEQTHMLRSSGIDLRDYPMTEEPNRTPVAALISPAAEDLGPFADAATALSSENFDARFAVIGPAHSPEMRSQLQRWQQEGVVEWWGHRDDLERALSSVHVICVSPGMTAHELVLASAAGRPLVSTSDRVGGRVLRSGDSAVFVRSNNVSKLTQSLRDLLTNREKRLRMGRRAREIVESEYSAESVAREIMGVYERLFEKGRAV